MDPLSFIKNVIYHENKVVLEHVILNAKRIRKEEASDSILDHNIDVRIISFPKDEDIISHPFQNLQMSKKRRYPLSSCNHLFL